MSRVLVTGGAGFLGSHLCRYLVDRKHDVVCVDNYYTGNKENVRPLLDYNNFELIRHDITFPLYLEVDKIYNLACPASPIHYQKDPVQTIKTIVHGSINMLGLAKRTGAKILQASTSEIYGDPQVSPQNENYWGHVNPYGVRSCYDEGKRCAESLFFNYNKQYGVDIAVSRIFNTYGPNMYIHDGRVVSNFIVQALRHEPITIYGDGSQTRAFCYVSDLIEGLTNFMELKTGFIGPLNLGNPQTYSVLQLAEKIKDLTNSESEIIFKELPEDDPKLRQPDISLAIKELKWTPVILIDEGLKKTIQYFDKLLMGVIMEL